MWIPTLDIIERNVGTGRIVLAAAAARPRAAHRGLRAEGALGGCEVYLFWRAV